MSNTKLEQLKKMIKFPISEDRQIFDAWEKRLSKSEKYKAWLGNPITKEIVTNVMEAIREVNRQAMESGLTPELKIRREVWSDFLHLFNPSADMGKIVEEEIGRALETFKEYYG